MYEIHAVDIWKRDVWEEEEACKRHAGHNESQIVYGERKICNNTPPPPTSQGFQTWCMRWVTARVGGESGFSGVSLIPRDRGSCSLEDVDALADG